MVYPSLTTWVVAGGVTAILSFVNWYLWRFAPVLPYPLTKSATGVHTAHSTDFKDVA